LADNLKIKNMDIVYLKFSKILDNLNDYRENDVVFIPKSYLELNSICLVHDPNDVEDDSIDEPKPARDRNLIFGLDMIDIKGIKSNLEQQGLKDIDNNILLSAINFYLENDAFILVNQL